MNVIDSSAWLEYFAAGENAEFFASAIEKTADLIVPTLSLFEVFKRILQQRTETEALQAREAGPAIIDEAVEREVDLILMGVKYKRRFGQFSLGNVVPYVLKNAPCPVILYHQSTT